LTLGVIRLGLVKVTQGKAGSRAVLFAILLSSVILITPFYGAASACSPTVDNWMGAGALAYWEVRNSTGSVVATIEVVIGEQGLDNSSNPDPAKINMLYVYVYHPSLSGGRISETVVYNVFFEWTSLSYAYARAEGVSFPWGNSTISHNITITWYTTYEENYTVGYYINWAGEVKSAPGAWRSSIAQIAIDNETGPHPSIYTSNWALIGANMKLVGTYRDWQVMLFRNRIYIAPPPSLTRMPQLQSLGEWDATYYGKLGMTPVDAVRGIIDEYMSTLYRL
jgi:hypothetical protein